MLTYEKKVYDIDFNIVGKKGIAANGKIIITQENDYNFNEFNCVYKVEYFLNDQMSDISSEDIEAYFNDKGIDDLESSTINIPKNELLEFLK